MSVFVGCCVYVMMLLYGVNRNDECVEGGESTIVDALAVAEKLRVTHPHHFATLVRVPSTYHSIHYERLKMSFVLDYKHLSFLSLCRDYPVHMVYRTPHIHLNGDDEVELVLCAQNSLINIILFPLDSKAEVVSS